MPIEISLRIPARLPGMFGDIGDAVDHLELEQPGMQHEVVVKAQASPITYICLAALGPGLDVVCLGCGRGTRTPGVNTAAIPDGKRLALSIGEGTDLAAHIEDLALRTEDSGK